MFVIEEVFGTAPIVDEYGDEITVTTLFPMGAEMKDIFRASKLIFDRVLMQIPIDYTWYL